MARRLHVELPTMPENPKTYPTHYLVERLAQMQIDGTPSSYTWDPDDCGPTKQEAWRVERDALRYELDRRLPVLP